MEGALEEEMFPGGWNSHIETNYTEYYPGHVKDAFIEIEMIPGGWNRQREASNTQQLLALLKALCRKK